MRDRWGHPRLFDTNIETDGFEPTEPKCKRCGSEDVRWRQQGGKWVLFSLTPGEEHVCEISTDGFEEVPE